jgi:hypothetical protein
MSPETRVCNRALLCIFEIVIEEDRKMIYEEGSKISKYDVSFWVIHMHCIFTVLLYGS